MNLAAPIDAHKPPHVVHPASLLNAGQPWCVVSPVLALGGAIPHGTSHDGPSAETQIHAWRCDHASDPWCSRRSDQPDTPVLRLSADHVRSLTVSSSPNTAAVSLSRGGAPPASLAPRLSNQDKYQCPISHRSASWTFANAALPDSYGRDKGTERPPSPTRETDFRATARVAHAPIRAQVMQNHVAQHSVRLMARSCCPPRLAPASIQALAVGSSSGNNGFGRNGPCH